MSQRCIKPKRLICISPGPQETISHGDTHNSVGDCPPEKEVVTPAYRNKKIKTQKRFLRALAAPGEKSSSLRVGPEGKKQIENKVLM